MKLISFDIESDFGFFRKPESNNTLNVSYNMIHRPAVLGILGAVIGLDGYKEKGEFPEYYKRLNHLKVGIAPLNHEQGNYLKTPIKYSNTVGYANRGATFLTEELTLIAPKYRIYVLLTLDNKDEAFLYNNLKNKKSEFIPYFGKNEFTAWWDNFIEYEFSEVNSERHLSGKLETLFIRNQIIRDIIEEDNSSFLDMMDADDFDEIPFMYFERLPVDFNLNLIQYQIEEMVYTNYKIKYLENLPNLFYLKNLDSYAQLI
ncbi:MAG TPA: type I-B CRISPR-associated protein Cas5b [Flavobacteriaceae bacterium]|nr:type I-B CRISPR-associated protein Cas5b [Flavobacteriaceae bacterium]